MIICRNQTQSPLFSRVYRNIRNIIRSLLYHMDPALLDRLVAFRRELHQYPQISFQEFNTHQRIKNILLSLGVNPNHIREVGKPGKEPTGLIVDLIGRAQPKGNPFCVAFRADMDALSMVELNHDLPYVSKNIGAAHMCGHDGHMTCLVGFAALFVKQLDRIPSNKKVRLLFQPSEEGPEHGAELIIKEGGLQGVNEVYGFHNWPTGTFGQIWCKEGAVMSQITIMKIKIIGEGGHGSAPQMLKVAVWKAVSFYQQIQAYIKKLQSQGRNFACTFPVLQAGERYNVISQSALIEGTLRSFDDQTRDSILTKIRQLLEEIKKQGFVVEYNEIVSCRNENSKKEAENVLRVGSALFGAEKVGKGTLPFRASQDFGCYTQVCPGAFFFFCTKRTQGEAFLHNARFDFKDDLIESASIFWMKLAEDRLLST